MAMKESVRGIVVLFATALVAGGLLAQVYRATAPRIQEQKRIEAERLNREIYPEGARFEPGREGDDSFVRVLDAAGAETGRIYEIEAAGYGGAIGIKVGVSPDGTVSRVKVLSQSETPGLGAKAAGEAFLRQFSGLDARSCRLSKDDPAGKVDAITAATISSRAVADAVAKLIERTAREKGD